MAWEFIQPVRHATPATVKERVTLEVTDAEVEEATELLRECAVRNQLAGWTPEDYAQSWLWIVALKSREQPAGFLQHAKKYAADIDRLLRPSAAARPRRWLARGRPGRDGP
jgi:hypothetical protein